MNRFNSLHGEESNEPPRECNNEPPTSHFKYITSPTRTSPVVSAIMRRLNHNDVDNVYVELHPSYLPVEFKSESVPDPNTTPIISIGGDEMYYLLVLFHS